MPATLRRIFDAEPRIAYALLLGSRARGSCGAQAEVEIAIGLTAGASLTVQEIGELTARLERVAGRTIELVLADAASPALAARISRDGREILVRDRAALQTREQCAVREQPASDSAKSRPARDVRNRSPDDR